MGVDLFFFGCQLREQLALDYLRGNGHMVPVHGFYHIFRALYQGSAVFLYQQVAAGGVGVAYAARKGEAVALVAFGYLGGNEGATFAKLREAKFCRSGLVPLMNSVSSPPCVSISVAVRRCTAG